MPTLEFKGKPFVYSHHLSAPFRELIPVPSKSVPGGKKASLDDNLIIHGDNLEALKALLPRYAGKVDVIYIDPPYNTGNEKWAYNDNVNSPLMKEWLGKVVDRDDLERHDKWLCMMWPRLQLLRELLSEKGTLWITLDDNELHHARAILDEVFGGQNFVACCIWQKVFSPKNTAQYFSEDHDYVLLYTKTKSSWRPNLLGRTEAMEARYSNPDNDARGPWTSGDLSARNFYSEGTYPITTPAGRVIDGPPRGMYWRVSESKFKQLDKDGRVWWGGDGNNQPRLKRYLSEVKRGRVPQTLWTFDEVGHTQDAKKELLQILDFAESSDVFVTPKPVALIHRILELASAENSVVLDSFAGSGTTAHAVLAANQSDKGSRRFILVETEDYADKLTAERIRRVIKGYRYSGLHRRELLREQINWRTLTNPGPLLDQVEKIESREAARFERISKQVADKELIVTGEKAISERMPGLGGSFTYCELGEPIDMDRFFSVSGAPNYEQVARYVVYTATGESTNKIPGEPRKDWFVAEAGGYRIHLIYKPNIEFMRSNEAALSLDRAKAISTSAKGKPVLVYAAAKFMAQDELTKHGITFCQLPYAVHRILGEAPDAP